MVSLNAKLLGVVSPDEVIGRRAQMKDGAEPEELINLCVFRLRREFSGANTVDVPITGCSQASIDRTMQLFKDKGWKVVYDPPFWLAFSRP